MLGLFKITLPLSAFRHRAGIWFAHGARSRSACLRELNDGFRQTLTLKPMMLKVLCWSNAADAD